MPFLPYILHYMLPAVFLISSFSQLEGSVAAVSNRTIDDSFGDSVTGQKPVFLPDLPETWGGPDCTFCRFIPDKTKAFDQTFNTATYRPEKGYTSIELNFKGTAIYVFFIIANIVPRVTTLTECNFTMDGMHAGYYRHAPSLSTNLMYNVLAFQSENLPNTDHMLNISTSGLNYMTYTVFDYAIYTFDDSVIIPSVAEAPNPPTIQPPLVTTTSVGTSNPTPTIFSAGIHPINGTESTVINQSGATPPSQGETQDSSTVTSTATSKPPPGNQSAIGIIVGGSVGGVTLIILALLIFMLYRCRKRIYKAKLTAIAAAPGHSTMAVTPFIMTSNYGHSHSEKTIPTTSLHLVAPTIHPNPGARGPTFPLSGYVDLYRDGQVYARLDSPEGSSDSAHRVVEDVSPMWHRRRGTRGARNSGGSVSTVSHDQPPAAGNGLADVVTLSVSMGGRQQSMYIQSSVEPPPEYTTLVTERRVGDA